jgi:hypothetical protein
MAENQKKIILTAKQKLKLVETFENRELATELAKVCGVGTEWLYP